MVDVDLSSKSVLHRKLLWTTFVAAVLTSVACDKYEPTKPIEGTYRPGQCVTLQGIIPGGWLSRHKTIHPTVCQPMRVSELGVYTYGGGWSMPGVQAEVGRIEFADAGVLVESNDLRHYGTFDYRDRDATLDDWTRNNPIKTTMLVLAGLVATVTIFAGVVARNSRKKRERERLEAEAVAHRARLEAEAAAQAAARAAALAKLRQSVADAQGAASSLPITLGEAEITLDRAQDELMRGLYSPFWEVVEAATAKLDEFNRTLLLIEARRTTYHTQAAILGSDAPRFSLGVSVLPDPAATHNRLTALYRKAQSNPHFAMVYEQRRTNAILIAGFSSLGQAIEHLGARIVTAISGLAVSLDCRLASLESSLESTANAAAEQSADLRAELQRSAGVNEAVLGQLRQDAEARTESERLALRMLDNIQRRRKPTMWERP